MKNSNRDKKYSKKDKPQKYFSFKKKKNRTKKKKNKVHDANLDRPRPLPPSSPFPFPSRSLNPNTHKKKRRKKNLFLGPNDPTKSGIGGTEEGEPKRGSVSRLVGWSGVWVNRVG